MLADRKRNDPFFSTVNCFELLPDEIILLIFSQLDPISLARSMMVCTLFENLLSDKSFWKELLSRSEVGRTLLQTTQNGHQEDLRKRYFAHLRKKEPCVRRVTSRGMLELFDSK